MKYKNKIAPNSPNTAEKLPEEQERHSPPARESSPPGQAVQAALPTVDDWPAKQALQLLASLAG